MKFKFTAILFLLFLFNVTNINGQSLLLEEDFNMTEGTELVGQNGWEQGIAGTYKAEISSSGLAYPNYTTSALSKAASFQALSNRVQKKFTGTLSDSYYYSFLINVSSAGSGDFFIGLFSGSAFRGRAYLKAEGDGFQIGLAKTTSGVVNYTNGSPLSYGTTHLVIVKYEFVAGSANDIVSLYLNPDLSGNEPTTATIGKLTDSGNDASANVLAIQARENAGSFIIDGIKIGRSWSELKGEEYVSHKLELPRFLSSNMVMQRNVPLKLWGWGLAGDEVKADFIRQGQTLSASSTIDSNGKWSIEFPSQSACKDACQISLSVSGHNDTRIELNNILIGDVWLCSGQSNMEKKVSHLLEANDYINEANNYPLIRSFRAPYNIQLTPQDKVNNSSEPWFSCTSDLVGDKVSAVSYVCARDIFDETDVPIGLLQSYRGGTELETWMSPMKFSEDPDLSTISGRNSYIAAGRGANSHSVNYNGQIHPLVGFPLKGFLWYQGESNTKRATEYRYMMKKLIEDWRNLWGQGDLPFYYVQMFNVWGVSEYEAGTWADLRDQQSDLLYDNSISNIGMCISIDTNEDPTNSDESIRMHPRNKKPVGQRLARIILRDVYNVNMLAEGPVLNRYEIKDDAMYLFFKNYGDGLGIKDGESTLSGFSISGENKQFQTATANIVNDSTVMVKNSLVANPVSVRYAWARNPKCNLQNSIHLPARPFRTDGWALTAYTKPQSSGTNKSSDASLTTIRLNGKVLDTFNPTLLNYNINESSVSIPSITVIPNHPFAEANITKQTANSIQVEVTAEDNSKQVYVFNFTFTSSIENISLYKSDIEISSKENNDVYVKNNSDEDISLKFYSLSGQRLHHGTLDAKKQKSYTINEKIILVKIQSNTYTELRKVIMSKSY